MLATNFNECNFTKFAGDKRMQCLKSIEIKGLCKKCYNYIYREKDINEILLEENIKAQNYDMVKYCLKEFSLSSYQIMKSCYSINILTPTKIFDLIYFNDQYNQHLRIDGKSVFNRLSSKTLQFMFEKIFLIKYLLDTYEDKGLLDLKSFIIITKIKNEHLDLLHRL